MQPKPPSNNPVFDALRALAPPHEWASIASDVDGPPSRFRVRLKLRHANYAHIVEVKLANHYDAETAWRELDEWFGVFASFRTHKPA